MIAILAHRRPAREQRPHRAVVISAAAESGRAIGDDAHAPIGLEIGIGELRDHLAGVFLVEQTKPHRHSRQDACLVHRFVVVVECKGVPVFLREPERVLHERALPLERLGQFLADIALAGELRQIRQRPQGFRSQARLVKLRSSPEEAGHPPPSRVQSRNSAESLAPSYVERRN